LDCGGVFLFFILYVIFVGDLWYFLLEVNTGVSFSVLFDLFLFYIDLIWLVIFFARGDERNNGKFWGFSRK
jgi:hypothetical protein